MSSQDDDSELYKLVKTHEVRSHSKTCWEIKSKDCLSNFGKFLTSHAVIAKPPSGFAITA